MADRGLTHPILTVLNFCRFVCGFVLSSEKRLNLGERGSAMMILDRYRRVNLLRRMIA